MQCVVESLLSAFHETVLSHFAGQAINLLSYDNAQIGPNWNSETFPAILELSLGMNPYLSKGNPSKLKLIHIHLVAVLCETTAAQMLITLFLKTNCNSGMAVNILTEYET